MLIEKVPLSPTVIVAGPLTWIGSGCSNGGGATGVGVGETGGGTGSGIAGCGGAVATKQKVCEVAKTPLVSRTSTRWQS